MRWSWRFVTEPLRAKGVSRQRLVLSLFVILALVAALLSYPRLWNVPAVEVAVQLEAAGEYVAQRTGKDWPSAWAERLSPEPLPAVWFGRRLDEFALGLDLIGGAHLEYEADLSALASGDTADALSSLRDTIERRVNIFGVREPLVQLVDSADPPRLIVELAGITDVNQAINLVGDPVFLEFREERPEDQIPTTGPTGEPIDLTQQFLQEPQLRYVPTELTGQYLKRSDVVFDPTTNAPQVQLTFNDEGATLFREITRNNIGKQLAIFLDNELVAAPTVQQEITGGTAVITGSFDVETARDLSRNLNAGALPVPISLVAQRTVGATLGAASLTQMLRAGLLTAVLIAIFMAVLYRLPGVVAIFSLWMYAVFMLALFKLVPVTLTLSGIAGFILSIGMAVDANILIFARMREERRAGRMPTAVVEEGFRRAWTAIRDSNVSTLLTTAILYSVGTSFVQSFALALGVGIAVSMFTAYVLTRFMLREAVRHPVLTRISALW